MIRKEDRRGERVLVIDIRYKKKDGTNTRYRKDAQVQTAAAATAEERRLLANIAQYGDVYEPAPDTPEKAEATSVITFGEIVEKYRATYMVTDLKITTRKGYGVVLDGQLLPRFKSKPIADIDGEAASTLDLELTKKRRAFGLMAYAGLRPNEVRALLRRDMKLRRECGESSGGFLTIREGLSYGETHTPKTGKREIPIARRLALLLGEVENGPREGHVAVTADGEPWGQPGIDQAFERVRDRAGLAGWSVYARVGLSVYRVGGGDV